MFFVDVNECNHNNSGCSHYCNNTDGSYSCSCPHGYVLYSEEGVSDLSLTTGTDWHLEHLQLVLNHTCVREYLLSLPRLHFYASISVAIFRWILIMEMFTDYFCLVYYFVCVFVSSAVSSQSTAVSAYPPVPRGTPLCGGYRDLPVQLSTHLTGTKWHHVSGGWSMEPFTTTTVYWWVTPLYI